MRMKLRRTDTWLSLCNDHSSSWDQGYEGPRDYKKTTLFRQWKKKLKMLETKNDTYQQRNILIYYCVIMIPIPIILYLESISLL